MPRPVPPSPALDDDLRSGLLGRPEPGVGALRRRRRQRLLPVVLVLLAGLVSTVAALVPGAAGGPEGPAGTALLPVVAGRLARLEAGVVLLLAVPALARGSRVAWAASVAVGAGTLAVDALQQELSLAGLLALAALAALVARARGFRSSVPLRSRLLRLPVGLLAALVLFAATAAPGLPAAAGHPPADRLLALARATVLPESSGDGVLDAWAWALRIGALLLVADLVGALRPCTRAWRGRARPRAVDVRRLAEVHGRSSTAPLVALPGSSLVPLLDGQALAGVAVRSGVAVTLGMPVAPAGLELDALAELTDACERRGLLPVLLGLDDRQRHLAEEWGFTAVRVGVEAFLDPAAFTTAGKRRSNVRHSVTRAERDGVEVLRYDDATRTPDRDAQLAAISAGWVARKGGPELGFTLGRFDLERLDEQEVVVALTGRGTARERVVAFVTWLPYDGGRQAVLDLMRRAEDCPPGTMEKLVVDSLADAARRGRRRVSLGGVPLASTSPRQGRAERALGWVYEHGRAVYDAHGLFRFKDKFAPAWEPLYAAAPARAQLPRVAVAVARAFLPPAALRTVVRTVAARQRASVRARVEEVQRPGPRSPLPWVPAVVCAALLAVAALTRPALGPLPAEVVQAAAWSTERVLAGEVWRAATASLLTRDLVMLLAMLVTVWPVLALVQRLLGPGAALLTWALGCLAGYLGTAALVGLLAPHWALAERTLGVHDYGPSSGVAAGLAVVVVVLRRRAVTWPVVGVLLVGSALHGQVADLEHVVAFAAAWVVARLLLRRGSREGQDAAAAGPEHPRPSR